jgi:hypothetical protein
VRLEKFDKLKKKFSDIGTGTRDFPACSMALQPPALLRAA